MLKKTLSYENLDGETVTKDFYFQITKAEVVEKAMANGDGYLESLGQLSAETNGAEILRHFKDILSNAVGQRQGQLFIKNDDIRNEFMYSGAYDQFLLEMLEAPDSGASQIRAILPKDAQKLVDEEAAKRGIKIDSPELPASPPVLEGEVAKPEPTFTGDIKRAVAETDAAKAPAPAQTGTDDDPVWLKEGRNPTRQELMKMSKDEIQFAAKMREAGMLK